MRWLERFLAAGLVMSGCGGQTETDASGEATNPGGTSSGGPVLGPAGGATATAVMVDDERDAGRPKAPDGIDSAAFWGSDTAGWQIGYWFVTSSDGMRDAGAWPIVPPREESTEGRRVTGADHSEGVVLWLQLDHPLNRAVDLSAYSGISFWTRLESASGRLVVALNESGSGASLDGRSTLPAQVLAVGPDWQEIRLTFDTFAVDRSSLGSIEFFVGEGGESFDLWVDGLNFLCAGVCP